MFKIPGKNLLNNKSVLITGGTGSLGIELTSIFLKNFNLRKIIIFSRDELKQSEHNKKFNQLDKKSILRYLLGDVRDSERLKFAFRGVDIVIHTAALKHVDQAEYNPYEFINTNINGAKNVIQASLENDVEKVIALSTDKAVNPINLYGATKLASDKLFVSSNNLAGNNKTRFAVVRYGNVINSRGSVAPFFLELRNNFSKFIPITHEKMTRFWITLKESIEMVLWALQNSKGAEIFVPKIPSFKILDLAKAINPKAKIKIIGIRQGEKIHEDLITLSDSVSTYDFGKYYAILNNYSEINIKNYNLKNIKKVSDNFFYNSGSNSDYLNISDLQKHLKNIL
jgi:UDP-N-acetylglucosamine 4,6-dehydratase (inverting)